MNHSLTFHRLVIRQFRTNRFATGNADKRVESDNANDGSKQHYDKKKKISSKAVWSLLSMSRFTRLPYLVVLLVCGQGLPAAEHQLGFRSRPRALC